MFFKFLKSKIPALEPKFASAFRSGLLGLFFLVGLILTLSSPVSAQKVLNLNNSPRLQLDNLNRNHQKSTNFISLERKLLAYGFQVKFEIPPYSDRYGRKPYGLVRSQEKTVWINPVVFDLGNELPVLIHESVHAAQICAGGGKLSSLNLDLEAPQIASPYFVRYHDSLRRKLEAEAYTVQTQSNSLDLVSELLAQHCSSKNQP